MKNKEPAKEQKNKKKSQFMRVLILVLVFCITVVTALVVSDLFLSDHSPEPETELVAVSVFSDHLTLNDGRVVTLSELREYMTELKASGKEFVGSIINDMANPADATLYNQVVDLFAEFGIFCDKLPESATPDEQFAVTPDEM